MRRDVVWEWLDRPGLEHLSLDAGPEEVTADGLVLVDLGGGAVRLRYAVRCDGAWDVRGASLELDQGTEHRTVAIERDGHGAWLVDGSRRPDLAGCTDIDIMASPFTNTLPIRRLRLRPDEARELRVLYIRVPELTVEAVGQEYTRLDPAEPPRRFRYRNLDNSFAADLAVDDGGIVVDYPGLWRRRAG